MGYAMFNGAKAFNKDISKLEHVLAVISQPNGCQDFCVDAGSSLKRPGLIPKIRANCGNPGCG